MRGLAADLAFICFADELSSGGPRLSPCSPELGPSTAHVALTETAPGSQQSRALHIMSSPSAATFDTAFFNQGTLTQSPTDHSIFVANSVSVTSNEVVIDDDEMDNFLPETQWTTSRVVSPVQYTAMGPPGQPEETSDPVLTPSLPMISSQDEEVTSPWRDTTQQPTTCAESPSHFSALRSPFLTSKGMIPTPSRNLVLYLTDPSGHSSSRTWLEIVASGTEGAETLLFSSTSSVPQPFGNGITQQPFPTSGEVSAPPEDVPAPGTDRIPAATTALNQSLEEALSPRTSPTAAAPRGALTSRSGGSSVHPALLSTPLASVSFASQSADAPSNPVLPGSSREAADLPGSSVVPSHADDTPVWSPVSLRRASTWCVSCAVASLRHVLSSSLTEKDVGSGDGAETMTAWEASSIAPPSSVVADVSDFEEEPQEYNLLFPSRPIVPLASRPVDISETSIGLSVEVDTSSVLITRVYPSHGRLSPPVPLDTVSSGSCSVAETQVMPSRVTAVPPSVITRVLLDSSFSVTADEDTLSLAAGVPTPFTSYGLDPSVEPASFSPETRSILQFASFSTPPLGFSSSAPSSPEGLAFPSLMSSDLPSFIAQAFSTSGETLTLSDSLSLWSPQPSVPNSTNLDFPPLWPSSDPVNASTFLPRYSEASPLSSFCPESLQVSEASAVSVTDAEAHFTSTFTETTSYSEFSLTSHDSAVPTLVPSRSEPTLDILTAGTHFTSLLTAFHTTPSLTESSLSPTPLPSDGGISATDDHASVLPSFSEVIPPTAVLVTAVSPASASSSVPEGVRSPVPTEPISVSPSFTPMDLPRNTSPELSTSHPSAPPDAAADVIPNSVPESQVPHESSGALPSPSLHPASTSAPDAAVPAPAVVTTKPPYVCDITVPDAYLITTGKALRHLSCLG